MILCIKICSFVFLLAILVSTADNAYAVPEVELEAISSGGFRAYIRDSPGITSFHFSANINKSINDWRFGDLVGKAMTPTNGYWIISFSNTLKVGDVINYWVVVHSNRLGYRKGALTWTVRELRDSYGRLDIGHYNAATTTVDGGRRTCIGQLVIFDEFDGPSVNESNWIVEHRIPTYAGPTYEFNSYENINDTRFFKNGKLYLKPIALLSTDDVHGILDLRQRCTSSDDLQCFFKQASSFLLPPVKSAKITSKISFKYGKVEIRAKLPAGEWIFPVIELEPKQKDNANATKLWIAYSRGNNRLVGNDRIDIGSRLLFAGPAIHPMEPARSKRLVTRRRESPFNGDFHVYTLEWVPGKMTFLFDDEEYGVVISKSGFADPSLGVGNDWTGPEAPFDNEYVLSLGVGVGGFLDFPDGFMSGNNPKPWTNGERNSVKKFFDEREVWLKSWNGDNTALQIDYVKVWAL